MANNYASECRRKFRSQSRYGFVQSSYALPGAGEKTVSRIKVRVRDISFEEIAELHNLESYELNPRYRVAWEKSRGTFITIITPNLRSPEQDCIAGGRVWLTEEGPWRSVCEHQVEIGD